MGLPLLRSRNRTEPEGPLVPPKCDPSTLSWPIPACTPTHSCLASLIARSRQPPATHGLVSVLHFVPASSCRPPHGAALPAHASCPRVSMAFAQTPWPSAGEPWGETGSLCRWRSDGQGQGDPVSPLSPSELVIGVTVR